MHRAAVVAALAVVLSFYAWTAFTNARTFPTQMDFEGRDYFNLLTDAFRQGQASLLVEPAPELLALEDPYDATKNYLANRVHDLSLYQGKYYLYWGPTPVITLFAPARLLLPGNLPERAAVVIYAFVALIFSLLLLRWLVHRYLWGTPPWMLWFGGVALATGNVMPFVLRRPTVYEVAISAGFCFSMAAVYFLLTGAVADEPSVGRLGLGSFCLALAIGARLTAGLLGLLCVAVLVDVLRCRPGRRAVEKLGITAAVIGPVALCGVLLLAYNQVRFGSLTEFGLRYQMNDVKPYPAGFGHVARGLHSYVLAPPRFDLSFPFFHLPPPPAPRGPTPPGYNLEPTGGLLAVSPIALLALVSPLALRRSAAHGRQLGIVLVGLVALGSVTLVTLVVLVNGVAMRYAADFTSLVLVVGVVMWIWLTRRWMGRLTRAAVAGAGALLIVGGSVVGLAISFTGNTDGLRAGHPVRFASLERAASIFPTAVTMVVGRPLITDVYSPTGVTDPLNYRTITRTGASFQLGGSSAFVRIAAPDDGDAVLRARVSRASPDPAGGVILFSRSGSGSADHPVSAAGAMTELPIRLTRGLNQIELGVRAQDARDGPLLEIANLQVSATAR